MSRLGPQWARPATRAAAPCRVTPVTVRKPGAMAGDHVVRDTTLNRQPTSATTGRAAVWSLAVLTWASQVCSWPPSQAASACARRHSRRASAPAIAPITSSTTTAIHSAEPLPSSGSTPNAPSIQSCHTIVTKPRNVPNPDSTAYNPETLFQVRNGDGSFTVTNLPVSNFATWSAAPGSR